MLTITIPKGEMWDKKRQVFLYNEKETTITLEHSLVSISKWESIWHIPFLSETKKTREQTISYIKCMTLTQNVKDEVYNFVTNKNIDKVNKYIDDPMTATWFAEEKKKKKNGKPITNELIYYWMFSLNIPLECQKWHFNRLITLIKVFNAENGPKKKMSKKEIYERNNKLHAERAKMFGGV